MVSVQVTSTCQSSWPFFFCQFLSVLPLLHLTLPEWQASSSRQTVLIMVHQLGILVHCIFPRVWERKQQEHGYSMLVCISLPLAYLDLSTSLLLFGAVPRVTILNHSFFLAVAKVTFSGTWRTLGHWQCLEDKNQEDLVVDVRLANKGPMKRPGTLRWCTWLHCGPHYRMSDPWSGTDSWGTKPQ